MVNCQEQAGNSSRFLVHKSPPFVFLLPIYRIIAIDYPIIVIIEKHRLAIWLGIYCAKHAGDSCSGRSCKARALRGAGVTSRLHQQPRPGGRAGLG
jgi:hypothetical protein